MATRCCIVSTAMELPLHTRDRFNPLALTTIERVWLCYFATMSLVALVVPGGGEPEHRPGAFVATQLALASVHVLVAWWARRRNESSARVARSLASIVSMPIAFSSMAFLLPAVHPEPWEWAWHAGDRWLWETDVTVALQGWMSPWFTELLQWLYAAFYVQPILAVVLAGWVAGTAAFDRSMVEVVFGFLVSYAGYLLFPTLGPAFFLHHGEPLRGVWLAQELNAWIFAAEANKWDCFPSGHTMIGLLSMVIVARRAPRCLWWFAPLSLLLVFSTMALRYHWFIDVLCGALLVWPTVRVANWMMDLDGAPRVR
ncbi:MAG: hypothetical protein RL148_918 [Planctomycetota bacterium]|jgi:membrane-associated phospholipid phosphatase